MNHLTPGKILEIPESLRSRIALREWVAALLGLAILTPASAHHSFAMFDQSSSMTLHGTVKELQWTNPHCYLQVIVPAQTGTGTAEWSIEMHSPSAMYRLGWRPGTYRSGDKVTVTINPLRDGANGGRLRYAIDASGKRLGSDKSDSAGGP